MSAQRTNSILVFVAVLVAAAIVVYAILNRTPSPTTPEGQDQPLPAETQSTAEGPNESADAGITHIDQTTDTTHAPAETADAETAADAPPTAAEGEMSADENAVPTAPPATLIEAASRGDVEALAAMIAAEHDLDATDAGGRTALMAAAGSGHIDAVFVLLNAGADPALRDDARRAARDYALVRYDEAGQTIARILGDAVGPPPVLDAGEK